MYKLPDYKPSEKLLQAFEKNFTDNSLLAIDATFAGYLNSQKLDFDNVSNVLKILLSIDDVSTMHAFAQIGQSNTRITRNQHEYTIALGIMANKVNNVLNSHTELVLVPKNSLLAPELTKERILALLPHPNELIGCGSPRHFHIGKITKVTNKLVVFKPIDSNNNFKNQYHLCKDFPYEILREEYDVIFRSPRVPHRLMYNALEELNKCPLTRRYLFPIANIESLEQQASISKNLPTLTLFNESIATNVEQLQAVQQIVVGPSAQAPYILFGPPGTGKTTTIVEAIIQLYLLPETRILVTAGSNSACDTVALRICEIFKDNELLSQLNYTYSGIKIESRPNLARLYAISHDMRKVNSILKKYCKCFSPTCEYLESGDVCRYKIIVATLCTVGRMAFCYKKYNFTHIFIDEAAASMESEALLGIVAVKNINCHVVLSGDHKQLGAVIKNDRAASLGLGQSLMERLLLHKLYEVDAGGNYDRSLQSRLRQNYRSHPEIVGLYNKLYYNSELIPLAPLELVNQAQNWSNLPNRKFPILFHAAFGKTERNGHSTSSLNYLEANVLCQYVLSLVNEGLGGGVEVKQEDIGVVTPYLAQCGLLKQKLNQRNLRNVEVGTVESYQGREKLIIIVSLVSSFTSPRFLSNSRRLNVFLSRAKSLMILIGNPKTLSENNDLKFIINQCKLQGNFLLFDKNSKSETNSYSSSSDIILQKFIDLSI